MMLAGIYVLQLNYLYNNVHVTFVYGIIRVLLQSVKMSGKIYK